MIRRETDPEVVNALLAVTHDEELDATDLVTDPRNIWLLSENGGAVFIWRGPGIYETHGFWKEAARGAQAIDEGKAMLSMMFDGYAATMIWALCPIENRAARMFDRKLGFRSMGKMEAPAGTHELFVMEGSQCL